jgi:hypothetical protein
LNPDGLALDLQFAADKTLTARKGPTPTFTRASTATFVGSDGLIQSAAINAPRFDHDPVTLACKGLLIEESRTNELIQSDTLATQTITVTAAARTLSFYGTGTVVLSGAHIATVTGRGAYPTRTTLTFTPTAGSLILTVIGSVRQAQLETGTFPTSYIPTTTASVVRGADVCSITGGDFSRFYNQSEGTISINASTAFPSNTIVLYAITDGTIGSQILALPGSSSFSVTVSGSNQVNLNHGIFTANVPSKQASAYKLDDFASSKNAGTVLTDNTGTIPAVNQMGIGSRHSSVQLNGHIASLRYYKKRLPDAKIQSLTT